MTTIEWAPEMLARAEEWPLYESTCWNSGSLMEPRREQACFRCRACDCVVFPPDLGGTLVHLSSHHGFRMDGTRDADAFHQDPLPDAPECSEDCFCQKPETD